MNPYFLQEKQVLKQSTDYPEFKNDLQFQQYKHKNRLTVGQRRSENINEQFVIGVPIQNYLEPVKISHNQEKYQQTPIEEQEEKPKEIIHKIHEDDTLEGLSLIYDVPAGKIQQRNGLSSNQIYYLKTIVIPNPKFIPQIHHKHEQDIKIRDFLGYVQTADRSQKTARYYLSENDWDVDKAVGQYKEDLQWQRNQNQKTFEQFTTQQRHHQTDHKKYPRAHPRNQIFYKNIEMEIFKNHRN